MKRKSGVKYLASGIDEFQPGSRKKVLRNLLGITSVRKLEDEELAAFMSAERDLIQTVTAGHQFTLKDLDRIHRKFLGRIYPWAGKYRDVNLSKGGFMFASAMAIPQVMKEFEHKVLAKCTPCAGKSVNEIAGRIAEVHVEFLLVHPYREGNGRTARLLATLMAYQAGMPGLDFGFIGSRGKEFDCYVSAIHAGLKMNYSPMTAIMKRALSRASRKSR